MQGTADKPTEITSATTEPPPRPVLLEAAGGTLNVGNPGIDWDRYYDVLETLGWDMQDLGGPADRKIRRIVRAAIRAGEVD